MLAVVKTPHIKLRIEGQIPLALLHCLRDEFGPSLKVQPEEELVELRTTDWYADIKAKTKPGDVMRIYRENHKWSQAELGRRLGGVTRHRVSDWECGRRMLSKGVAKKLAKLLGVPVERLI